MKKGDYALFYLPKDRYVSQLSYDFKPDETLFRQTARIGIIEEVKDDTYVISYVHIMITYTTELEKKYVTLARTQSWNAYFGSFVNPLTYQPTSVIAVGAGGYLVYKYFN